MGNGAVRAVFFDASVLVKRYLNEVGRNEARAAFNGEPTKYTSPFCFYEALSVLKNRIGTAAATRDDYLNACLDLTSWYGSFADRYSDLDFADPRTFGRARKIVLDHGIDLSDAFQIVSVRDGFFSRMCGESATILATADRALAKAARSEGLRTWMVLDEPRP